MSTFTEKCHLSQLTHLWMERCFASSRDKIYFVWKRVLIMQRRKKGLMCWIFSRWWWELGWSRYPSFIITSGARDIHHVPFSSYLRKCFDIFRYFDLFEKNTLDVDWSLFALRISLKRFKLKMKWFEIGMDVKVGLIVK